MIIEVDLLPCGCLIISPDQEILFLNKYFSDALDWPPRALIGQNMSLVLNKAAQLFCESYVIPMVLQEGQCSEVLVSLTAPDGATYQKVANVRKMPDGNIVWVFLEAENRTSLFKELEAARLAVQEQREQLEVLARTDELTGLANRRELDSSVARLFLNADRYNAAVAVVVLDIDLFKSVNDTFGHDVGDQVICALADILKSTCRRNDIVARMGGDEFVCVCLIPDPSHASALSERIHQAVERTPLGNCRFTVSVGFAIKPHDVDMAFPELLKLADKSLYVVKENGRNASHMITASAA